MIHISCQPELKRIAFVGNYLPRQCGIATFTTDLCEAIAGEYPGTACIAMPINDTDEGYPYPERVRFELAEKDIDSYRRASNFLNINDVDLVCLQFEYGIFGGKSGSHILAFLRRLRMPVVTTLHTVLQHPDTYQLRVLKKVAAYSDRLVVMSARAAEFLRDIYEVEAAKIDVIPHGIPDVPFVDPNFYKDSFGVEGKTVLLTFGLLSANKGIENVINALPDIAKIFPNITYMLVGATHPHVKRFDGERYRLSLQALAREKGVEDKIIYCNRFVTIEELIQYISAADIYITPYLSPAQIVSGTLAYAVGVGKAVISTPYWYAEELLDQDRGILVPFNDPAAIAEQVIGLLENEAERHAMRKRAYMLGREMIWPEVAHRYMESFCLARMERRTAIATENNGRHSDEVSFGLPIVNVGHLIRLTDTTGIFQHALYTIPSYAEGYTTDDNARALIVSTLLEELGNTETADLAPRYLAFLWFAFNDDVGRFRNFMNYQRVWMEDCGSDDSHGRALWALGTVLGRSSTPSLPSTAGRLFERALASMLDMKSPRAWAFALLGIHEYLHRYNGDRVASQVRNELVARLSNLYAEYRTKDWHWFEPSLTYCNATLSHAVLLCGQSMSDERLAAIGLESLEWLTTLQTSGVPDGHFVPIGSNGFYHMDGDRARFDQQPVEVQSTVSACLEAFRMTEDPRWREEARRAFEWFLGRNDLNLTMCDPLTGGCRDGLHSDRPNENQGAESTLAYLQALIELRLFENSILTVEVSENVQIASGAV